MLTRTHRVRMVTALAMNTDDYVIWFTVGEDREITGPIGA